ncbi:MAG: AbrB/MazE/SpoVT family DNA-binding domain-containing protein [Bacilli bacterium]|nr:AbrB/MazE/SpoVT family DNA-binding domain-containing protein [Acholeplasmataceae bacterium]MDY2902077.1 AbrB/MazE/SpoVT family DNA-binding domain-containing protein [Bacilli bacterium]
MKNIKDDRFIVSVKVGEKGQIVIPKIAREMFNINPQDTVMILGDKEKGLAILKADEFYKLVPSFKEENNE